MTLKMTAEEYDGVIKYLLSLPMSRGRQADTGTSLRRRRYPRSHRTD